MRSRFRKEKKKENPLYASRNDERHKRQKAAKTVRKWNLERAGMKWRDVPVEEVEE